jgi:hypothetical protein
MALGSFSRSESPFPAYNQDRIELIRILDESSLLGSGRLTVSDELRNTRSNQPFLPEFVYAFR